MPPASPGAVVTDPAGSFEVRFTAAPAVSADPAGTGTSYLVNVDEDSESLSIVVPTAFGASAGTSADERVRLFLAASGDGIEVLANTPTRLGPYPAAYFIARSPSPTGGGPCSTALLSSATETSPTSCTPTSAATTATGVGRSSSPTRCTSTRSPPRTGTDDAGTDDDDHPRRRPGVVRRALVGAFPDGADVSLRASSEDGFAYAEYVAVVGDDTLSVRVTELPATFEWDPAGAAAADARRTGGTVVSSETMTIGDSPAARFTLTHADSESSGVTTEVLQVRTASSCTASPTPTAARRRPDAAAGFIDSFHLR